MRTDKLTVLALLIGLLVTVCGFVGAQSVPEEARRRMRDAAPAGPTVEPKSPRRLLVYDVCNGYRHGSIPFANAALRVLGRKTGAFEVVVAHDRSVFEPETLKTFDAVCLNNTTGELFVAQKGAAVDERAEQLRRSLLDFVAQGGGLVGIHAATDCSYEWPEYGKLIGAYFWGHPWNEEVGVKLDEPDHPLSAAFGSRGFSVADEIYQFRAPYSRARLRVLLSLDTDRTDMTKKGVRRKDGDFAVSWVTGYGRGRVFYCSLGHRRQIFWNPDLLRHYLDGIQFAVGDLKADMTPSVAAGDESWESLFDGEDLSKWDFRPGGWHVEDGTLAWSEGAGFIWSKERYGDFVLDLEFKVADGTNSGIFIRTGSRRGWLHSGIEVQVLDSHGREDPGKHDCGAIYDCLAPTTNAVKPPGQWNHATITCKDNFIYVIMNGEHIIDMDLNRWTEPHRNPDGTRNKFNRAYRDMPREGYLGFQDHGHPVWYRNIRIKRVGDAAGR
ncbi:MAG: family 16 glycoside hydrolase [Planctomycetota bacterium]